MLTLLRQWLRSPGARMQLFGQILHCTFGSVLTDPTLGPLVKQVVGENVGTYTEVLAGHFGRHLDALKAGM